MPVNFQFTPRGQSEPAILAEVERELLSTLGLEDEIHPDHWHTLFLTLRNVGTAACWESTTPNDLCMTNMNDAREIARYLRTLNLEAHAGSPTDMEWDAAVFIFEKE